MVNCEGSRDDVRKFCRKMLVRKCEADVLLDGEVLFTYCESGVVAGKKVFVYGVWQKADGNVISETLLDVVQVEEWKKPEVKMWEYWRNYEK